MDINVRLGGGGGSGGRQSKLSAKHTSNQAIRSAQSNNNNPMQTAKTIGRIGKSALGGSGALLSTMFNYTAPTAILYGVVKVGERILNFGSQFRQSRSGENMLESNYRARLKTGVNLGLNVVYGQIKNALFTQPQIERQNYAINYDRDLYNYQVYGDKNKTR